MNKLEKEARAELKRIKEEILNMVYQAYVRGKIDGLQGTKAHAESIFQVFKEGEEA